MDIIGNVPPELGMKLDISAAICAKAVATEGATAFLNYITRPEAAADWKVGKLNLAAK